MCCDHLDWASMGPTRCPPRYGEGCAGAHRQNFKSDVPPQSGLQLLQTGKKGVGEASGAVWVMTEIVCGHLRILANK